MRHGADNDDDDGEDVYNPNYDYRLQTYAPETAEHGSRFSSRPRVNAADQADRFQHTTSAGTRKAGDDYNSQSHSGRNHHHHPNNRSSEERDKDNRDKDRDSRDEGRGGGGAYSRRRGDYSQQEETTGHRKTYQEQMGNLSSRERSRFTDDGRYYSRQGPSDPQKYSG